MSESARRRLLFGASNRLKSSREFAELKEHGLRLAKGCLIANWRLAEGAKRSKLGVITSRKVGAAHVRNRARRLLRECFRIHQYDFVSPVDMVLIARPSIKGLGMAQVERDFLAIGRTSGLLQQERNDTR